SSESDYTDSISQPFNHQRGNQMSLPPSSTKVLVTGASGFIGLHTTLSLLQLGYQVRGTVRSEEHAKGVRDSLSKHVKLDRLELIQADLLNEEGWREAAEGCEYAIHVASPFPAEEPKDPNELIRPARDGTLRVLRAAQAAGVRRLVLISSVVAITGGHEGENRTFDESDWTDLEKCKSSYSISKTMAERAAWNFVHTAENHTGMEMVSINPTNVFGPPLDGRHFTSTEWFRTLMRGEVPGVSRTQLDFVDVRDVVDMSVRAMITPAAANKRFLLNAASIPMEEFAKILQRHFGSRGYKVPMRVMPNWVVHLFAMLIPKVRNVALQLNWTYTLSTEQARAVLGWQAHPYEQTVIEMGNGMIEHGQI
ncbi:MAG: NAD-dependent epimerase/dehydratase family protein, partial [Chloroflexota bacterium]